MPLTSGRMQLDHEMKIKYNINVLNENVDAKDLVDYFIQEEIFDFPDMEQINGYSPNTRENRNQCFFQLLFNSGPRAYEVFLGSLENQRQEYLVDMILDTEIENTQQAVEDPTLWIHNVPKRRAILADKDLARLCNTLSLNWELAMLALGLSDSDVWRCKADNQMSVKMQIYAALTAWKRKFYNQAHLENFVTAVGKCEGLSIDWNEVKAVAMNL